MGSKPTIGFMINQLHGNYQSSIWRACMNSLVKRGLGCVWFPGFPLNVPYGYEKQHNIILQLLRQGRAAGVLAASGSLTGYVTADEYDQFVQGLQGTPYVSLSLPVAGRNSVVVDNRVGIAKIIHHLTDVHECKRIGFLKGIEGHWEADERYASFIEAMERHGLPVDPGWILQGTFQLQSGKQAVRDFLKSGQPLFDALVCCNDEMALGAHQAFSEAGISVPDDVKLTGYDDIEEAYSTRSPLTTARVAYNDLLDTALSTLIDEMSDRSAPHGSVSLPASLVVRRSCGCFDPLLEKNSGLSTDSERKSISGAVHAVFGDFVDRYGKQPCGEVIGQFLRNWEKALSAHYETKQDISGVIKLLTDLKKSYPLENLSDEQRAAYDQAFFDAIALCAGLSLRGRLRKSREEDYYREYLQHSVETIISTIDRTHLLASVMDELPKLGLKTFYLSLYKEEIRIPDIRQLQKLPDAQLLLAVDEGAATLFPDELYFPSGDLVPRHIFDVWGEHGRNFIVLPLFFNRDHYGFIIVEFLVQSETLYETLRMAISTALKNCSAGEQQQKVTERLYEANQKLKELSVLDDLTGLYNRRGFLKMGKQYLELAQRNERSFLVIYIDLDGLKPINDRWGHSEGDWAIRECARILQLVFRKVDLVARMGGDEFTVFAFDIDLEGLPIIRTRLNQYVNATNSVSGKPFQISMSLGAASHGKGQSVALDELLKVADQELYEEKQRRKKLTVPGAS